MAVFSRYKDEETSKLVREATAIHDASDRVIAEITTRVVKLEEFDQWFRDVFYPYMIGLAAAAAYIPPPVPPD